MATVLDHPDVSVRVEESGNSKNLVSVAAKGDTFVPIRSLETAYPVDLIEHVLRVKGVYVGDEIMRDEAPLSIQQQFTWNILSYLDPNSFAGRRVLDFGCGSGASTMVLARMLPETTQFVGVDPLSRHLELARHRARWYGVSDRITFHQSPDPNSLPDGIGPFDFVVFSAVYEHLLPAERRILLPLIWRGLSPGGTLFLHETPFRWSPVETHTTGLPLINYLPDRLAHRAACRFSKRVAPDASWSELLRDGIRGGTTQEILGILAGEGQGVKLLTPCRQGVHDHIELWFRLSSPARAPLTKRCMMWAFKALKAVSEVSLVPWLSLAIQKVR